MTVEAYAKVNLTLEVLGRRTDGYHALRSLVVPISLSDTLDIDATDDGELTSDSPYPDDLCLKAARALRAAAPGGVAARLGARIHAVKRIPAGGGLGGGSADAAATLRALNGLWGLGMEREALAGIGATVGSDVPALVLGGAVLMEGRGELTTPFPEMPVLHLVLANPGVFTSTKAVYDAWSRASAGETAARPPNSGEIWYNMRAALRSGDLKAIGAAMVNDLAAPAAGLHPEIAETMEALRLCGAEAVSMTGSGSTAFGLVPDEARGRETAALLEAKGLRAWSVRTCPVM